MRLFILGTRKSDDPKKGEGNEIAGWIESGELIQEFSESWFPPYQRDRVQRKKKIHELKETILAGESLPAVTLNLVGKVRAVTDGFNFEGDIHVIDGQQRIRAMIDTGKKDYLLVVTAHINLDEKDEKLKFIKLNTKGTKLPFGYLTRALDGPGADLIRRLLKRGVAAVPISVNDRSKGITVSWLAPIVHMIYKRLVDKTTRIKYATTSEVTKFLSDESPKERLSAVEFATKNLLAEYAKIFGNFDSRAQAYARGIFLPVTLVMIHNFITSEGKFNYKSFRTKIEEAPHKFLNSSFLRQVITSAGSNNGGEIVYAEFVKYLNRGNQEKNRLPLLSDLRDRSERSIRIRAVAGDASSELLTIEVKGEKEDDEEIEEDDAPRETESDGVHAEL